jgi:ribosomal protein S18 acetylase RimI-like enzyme
LTSIIKAGANDAQLLSEIAVPTFIESHGHSAKPEDINIYVTEKCSQDFFKKELSDPKNIYHFIYHDNKVAGYSKIIFDTPYANAQENKITKLERIYLLREFYGLKLGQELIQHNIDLSKKNHQKGIWLFVWIENPRAINFYKRNGFAIIGSYDFKISENHSNPNYQMLLKF